MPARSSRHGPLRGSRRRLHLESLEQRQLLAGVPEYITSVGPTGMHHSWPPAMIGDTAYFAAHHPAVGSELYRLDDATNTLALVKDASAGSGIVPFNDQGYRLTPVNNKFLYFAFEHPTVAEFGNNLFVSDGTAAGTHRLFDRGTTLNEVPDAQGPIVTAGRRALFTAHLNGLWISDGTVEGTHEIPGAFGSPLLGNGVAGLNDAVFFVAPRSDGMAVWKSDGSAEGTIELASFQGTAEAWPRSLVMVGNTLYFATGDSEHGVELWKSDGTSAGTVRVRDIDSGTGSSSPANLVNLNGQLAFTAYDGVHGTELWISDGTADGTLLAADLLPGSTGSTPLELTSTGTELFFKASDGATGQEVWRYDAVGQATTRLTDFAEGDPSGLVASAGAVFFRGPDGKVWHSDGESATAHVVLVQGGNPLSAGELPLAAFAGGILLDMNGTIWRTDGTAEGTRAYDGRTTHVAQPGRLTDVGGTLYFTVANQLWKSDGTAEGTVAVATGQAANHSQLVSFKEQLYFIDGVWNQSKTLWRTDGVLTEKVFVFPNPSYTTNFTATANGKLIIARRAGDVVQLWSSDGSGAGTQLVRTITGTNSDDSSEQVDNPTEFQGKLYFTVREGVHQVALWASDGTVAGTIRVGTLAPEVRSPTAHVTVLKDQLFIGITGSSNGGAGRSEVWTSDGTPDGTQALPWSVSTEFITGPWIATDDYAFFVRNSKLYRTDGTAEGTIVLSQSDYNRAYAQSPTWEGQAQTLGNILYFRKWDSQHEEELWRTDGSPEGTYLVQDTVAPGSLNPSSFERFNDQLFFAGTDFEHGTGLWRIASSADPVLTVSQNSSFQEDAAPVLLAPQATVSDVDSEDFVGGTLTVSIIEGASIDDRLSIRAGGEISISGNEVLYNGNTIGRFEGGSGQTPLTVSLTEGATRWATQLLLRSIQFHNSSESPTTAARTIRFVLRDGDGGWSSPATITTTILSLNDAPILNTSLTPTLAPTREDAVSHASTLVASLLTDAVTEPDGSMLRGIAVTAASNYNGTWQYSLNRGATWLAMGAVSETAARLLPGSAHVRFIPKADFNGTVQLWYRAWDQTQGSAGGTFNLVGKTGGAWAFSTAKESASLTVAPVNDPPRLVLSGSLGYVHDSAAVTLAAAATVSDIDSPNFAGGRLRVWITDGASTSNRLTISSGFTIDANNNVLLGSTIIGKRASNGYGTKELIITFNRNATPTVVQQLVRAITFKTVGGAAGKRTVLFNVSDGDGGVSNEATKTVNVS